jgi:WD40 repeat protein
MMSKLVVRQTFGISSSVNNCISFTDDHQLAYVSGNHLTLLNTDTKEQSFVQLGNTINGVNAYAYRVTAMVCSIIKLVIAIAETIDTSGIVTFYDSHSLKKKKTLVNADLGSNSIVSLSFSEDGRHLLVPGAGPEWNLVLWNVEKTPKILSSIKSSLSDDSPVHQVSICPWDYTTMVTVGKNILKAFKYIEGSLRQQPLSFRRDNIHVSAHCWLQDDRLLLATESGEIILFENLEYRAVIYPSSGNTITREINSNSAWDPATGSHITCVIPSSRGFITGGRNGEIQLFERKDDSKDYYVKDDTCTLPGTHCGTVLSLTIGPDDTFVCATNTQQIYSTVLNNFLNNKNDHAMSSSIFEPVLAPFHGPNVTTGEASILGIDVALWRRIVVTCGKDGSVRLWNLSDRRIELMKYFDEIPFSVAIHPSGLNMAIAFADRIKLMSVLQDDFVTHGDIPVRSCSFVKFSHGGQYLAAVVGPTILVYDTFSCGTLCTFRGTSRAG